MLKKGEFIIGNYHSSELNTLVENRPIIQKPTRKVNYKEVPGRSGTLLFDEKAYNNTPFALDCFLKAETEGERDYMRDLIAFVFDSGQYIDFIPYFDNTKIYKVQATSAPQFEGHHVLRFNERYKVQLTAQPYKFIADAPTVSLTSGATINNPSFYASKPIITITGTGDCTLTINGRAFVVKNIQDSIIINSAIPSAYRLAGGVVFNEENKIYTREFPLIDSGNNVISWTGAFAVTIETRWWTL